MDSPSVRLGGLFFFFCSVSSFPLLLSNRPSRLLFLPCFWFSLLLLTHFSLNAQRRWYAGWLGLIFSLRKGVSVTTMAAVDFGKRLGLLLLPWLRPPLFLPMSPFFYHVQGWCMQLGLLVLLCKEILLQPKLFWGERKGYSLFFAVFIPLLNVKRCLKGWLPMFLSLFGSS